MLPLEIVEEIFDYEGDADALRRWKCVSKRFALRVKAVSYTHLTLPTKA